VIQCLAPAFGRGNSYIQIILNLGLPDEVTEVSGSEAGIKLCVLGVGFTRCNTLYFLPPWALIW